MKFYMFPDSRIVNFVTRCQLTLRDRVHSKPRKIPLRHENLWESEYEGLRIQNLGTR